eukprot:478777_1
MADNKPPPFPPAGIDIMKMMEQAKKAQESQDGSNQPPSMTSMAAAEKITTTPFLGDEPAFESDTVREEYEALCRDHNGLVNFGKSYATFDPMGKIAYLDEIDKIEERWDVFFCKVFSPWPIKSRFREAMQCILREHEFDRGWV